MTTDPSTLLWMYLLQPIMVEMSKALSAFVTAIWPWICEQFKSYRKTSQESKITISSTVLQNKNGTLHRPFDKSNSRLIEAIIWFLSEKCPQPLECELSLDTTQSGKGTDYEIFKESRPVSKPLSSVTYNGFIISVVSQKSEVHGEKDNNIVAKDISIVTITSKKPIAEIRKFVDECYDKWIDATYTKPGPKPIPPHYYFILHKSGEENVSFRRYEYVDDRGFDDIWFPGKNKLVSMMDEVTTKKRGRLNVVLYGPPGTGKTSTIRAIANRTKRHIFQIKLSLIKHDMQFMDILHCKEVPYYLYSGGSLVQSTMTIPLNQRLYVFEDIDAECLVVHKREDNPLFNIRKSIRRRKKDKKKESSEEPKDSSKGIMEKEKIEKQKKPDFDMPCFSDMSGDEMCSIGPVDRMYGRQMSAKAWKTLMRDSDLTLSGILNAFDGVLVLNGTMCVLTTNHIEILDPALIRDGRMDLQLCLEKMTSENAKYMIKKHFPNSDTSLITIPDNVIEPCCLESFCRTSETLRDLDQKIQFHLTKKLSDSN